MLLSAQNLRLGWMFTFQQDTDPKHTTKTTQVWIRDKTECPRVSQPAHRLEPNQKSLERPVNSCAATHPTWQSLRGLAENGTSSQNRNVKLVASYPRLKPVITAKGASTKSWVKGLNTYVNLIFPLNWQMFIKLANVKPFIYQLCCFRLRLQHNQMGKKSRGLNSFQMHCTYMSTSITSYSCTSTRYWYQVIFTHCVFIPRAINLFSINCWEEPESI
jgi:hypothetical protein